MEWSASKIKKQRKIAGKEMNRKPGNGEVRSNMSMKLGIWNVRDAYVESNLKKLLRFERVQPRH